MVTPPTLSEVSVDPTSVTAEALKDIEVTYAVQDTVKKGNTITTELPRGWDPGFGRDFGDILDEDEIDLDGDSTVNPPVDAVSEVRSLPEDGDTATTSYVTVEYDAAGAGRNRMNTAADVTLTVISLRLWLLGT